MAHCRKDRLLSSITVPLRTEKYPRQSRQRYGIERCEGVREKFIEPHVGHAGPTGQRTLSIHRRENSSSRNKRNKAKMVTPPVATIVYNSH